MAKKRDQVDSGLQHIIDGARLGKNKAKKATGKPNPLGVPVTAEEKSDLTEIANELGLARSKVMHFAIKKFISDWKSGDRPKVIEETKVVKTLELE